MMAKPLDITIRAVEPEAYEGLAHLYEMPKAQAGTLQLPLPSLAMWKERAATQPEDHYRLVAVADKLIVGNIGLQVNKGRRKHTADLGIAVRDDYQGRGVGTALVAAVVDLAENWLGVTRIELSVFADNPAAIALYKKFNFEVEGTHRCYAMRNGTYVDALSMARLSQNLRQK